MKKITCLLLTSLIAFSLSAFAFEETSDVNPLITDTVVSESQVNIETQPTFEINDVDEVTEIVPESFELSPFDRNNLIFEPIPKRPLKSMRSRYVPTSTTSLPYSGSSQSTYTMYTNYKFKPNSDGTITLWIQGNYFSTNTSKPIFQVQLEEESWFGSNVKYSNYLNTTFYPSGWQIRYTNLNKNNYFYLSIINLEGRTDLSTNFSLR